jgi:haloalkane dehalogenase
LSQDKLTEMANPPEESISGDFPFVKKNVSVLGSQMAFVDVGSSRSTATVFLHGNPTSSYLWRNIIPHVAGQSRCIAPDLIGLGDSGKVPSLEYRISDHIRYIDAFMDAVLPTEKIVLVIHDWGSAIGLDWASRHEDRLAGIALMEFIAPINSWSDMSENFNNMFSKFRTPELGRKLLIEQNLFVERVLQSGIVRPLTDQEMTEYRRPFLQVESREPTWRFPNEIPIEGHPKEMWDRAHKYMVWLMGSEVRKLFFWVTPGVFVNEERAKRYSETLKNTKTVFLGKGSHFVQEDHPNAIGTELAKWLPSSRGGSL